jgi:hypothetical protein
LEALEFFCIRPWAMSAGLESGLAVLGGRERRGVPEPPGISIGERIQKLPGTDALRIEFPAELVVKLLLLFLDRQTVWSSPAVPDLRLLRQPP